MAPTGPARAMLTATVLLLAAACSGKHEQAPPGPGGDGYAPGLGEIMGLNQIRHAKLWFAARAGNWPLAAYEIDELREGFDDAVRYHPHHKSVPRPLTGMVPEYVERPLDALDSAVQAKDESAFTAAFDSLTDGCNACHREAGFGFNVVKRPTVPPYSNQAFEPAEDSSP